jgi:ribulose-phosphate 3-epimerase
MPKDIEITPAILAKTESEFREKVDKVRSLELTLHVDVMDGHFVPQVAWADPSVVEEIMDDLEFEVHLMVSSPEHAAIVWLSTSAKRVWVHAESTEREEMIFRSAPKDIERLGLVINPETPISRISHYLDVIPAILVMGVTPGASGQEFQSIAIEKVRELKRLRPHLWVKVDGGVNAETLPAIKEAGADQVAAASALTDQPDVTEALMRLQRALHPEETGAEHAVHTMYGTHDVEVPESPSKSLEDQLRDLVMDKAAPISSDSPLNIVEDTTSGEREPEPSAEEEAAAEEEAVVEPEPSANPSPEPEDPKPTP